MGIVGTIVKTGIDLSHKLSAENPAPVDAQKDQLLGLLDKAKNTSFGKYYGFQNIIDSDDPIATYQSIVPIYTYEEIHKAWWKQQQLYPDITWPGHPDYFALSSGTTGKTSKRIPITNDFVQSVRKVGASMLKSLPNFELPKELFESEILMLSSSADLAKNQKGFLEGEISGINVSNFPGWYDTFYRPGKDIATIDDWDERVRKIAEEAPNWNIGAMAGIPSWILLMLKEIVSYHKLDTIHDIWPNLTVYSSGGVAFDTYKKDFDKLCAKPLLVLDTYLASEGFFAYTSQPDTMAMELALNHGYFYEFVPFKSEYLKSNGNISSDAPVLTIDKVKLDEEYILIISSCSGSWRYIIGDTIKFTSLDPPQIKITGRTKFFLNAVGSQLSEEKMDKAILEVSNEMSVTINEYMVSALKDEESDTYYHQWVVVADENVDAEKFKSKLDESLQEANKNYKVARSKALKDVSVKVISKDQYYEFLEKSKKKGGQVKTPKVMKEKKMKKLLETISD